MKKFKAILLISLSLTLIILLYGIQRSQCKYDWDDTCSNSRECCSNYCDNNKGLWPLRVCIPKKTETEKKLKHLT